MKTYDRCRFDGCDKNTEQRSARGYCMAHYAQLRNANWDESQLKPCLVRSVIRTKDDPAPDGFKTCNKCLEVLPLEVFTLPGGSIRGHCYPCDKIKRRVYNYGLEHDEFLALLNDQNGRCAICSDSIVENPVVDHDHETGEVRGLLCTNCNSGIGLLRDDPEMLEKAISYLRGGDYHTGRPSGKLGSIG